MVKIFHSCAVLGVTAVAVLALAQTPSEPAEDKGMSSFGKMIPLGYVNENVTVPSFNKGRSASLLTAASLTRVDEERLSASQVVVQIYAENPAENLKVDLKSAIYHMTDQILRSGERSRVTRADFEMEGDSMVFDTVSSIGSMKGRVRTLIFDTGEVSGKSEDSQPSN